MKKDVKQKVLIYDDASEFGGHEIMIVMAIRYLVTNKPIHIDFLTSHTNSKLASELSPIADGVGTLKVHRMEFRTKRFQNIIALFSFFRIREIFDLMQKLQPAIVLIVQGRIEACSLGLLAARKTSARVISYIPLAHSTKETGVQIASYFRDLLNAFYYSLPHQYITVSPSMRRELVVRGVAQEISVVENGIDFSKLVVRDRVEARAQLGVGDLTYVAAIIGRIHFRQKAHDFLIQALAVHRDLLGDYRLLVVGSGPDENNLRALVQKYQLDEVVTFVPWSSDLSGIYSALDMVLIPSWFEGVPLVMLEAMYYQLPIVATSADGMADTLPPEWLFKKGDAESFISVMMSVRAADNRSLIARHRSTIISNHSPAHFGEAFYEVLNSTCDAKSDSRLKHG